ncbi:MAG: hypothetical protein Q7S40_07690 [Opitutaceae bacterium]|nr:hypothetical protein [Opitutaceae bacterium]
MPAATAVGAEPAGVLLEAEHHQQRVPNDNTFATTIKSASASGGAALSRFFGQGYVAYDLTAGRAGTYHLWVRYSSNQPHALSYAVDATKPGDPAGVAKATLPATTDLDTWNWAPLGEVTLRSGRHRLTVHAAALRLDCFWVTLTGQRPPEQPKEVFSREKTREHLRNPIEPITPGWLVEADAYQLPAWYEGIRVSAHTRLSWPMRTRMPDTFAHAGRLLHSIGFKEISRHIKSGSEPAWWPSAVGAVMEDARTRNVAREIIEEAHANGCRIMVYSRHMEDDFMAKTHPEWHAQDEKGPKLSKRGDMMCLNTPYAAFMETRLVELARMGADGFYFDEVHMPKPICYCDTCRRGFKQATGLDYPAGSQPADPVFQKAIEYRNTVLERVFRQWRTAIHRVNPECVMLIGSNTYPAMNDRHTTHRLWRVADAMKSEFNLAARVGNNRIFAVDRSLAAPEVDARLALAYTLDRDACDGRPPHVWAHGITDATQMTFAAAGMITHGQVANLDHSEAAIPDPARFGPAVALGNRVAPAFAGARPLRWAAVHFSEYARDHYVPDEAAMWKQVLYPVYGAFTALLRAHLPVGIVTDSQLEQGRLDGYRVLFLPAAQHLTERMRQAVAAFEARGGLVVRQKPEWVWHQPVTGMKEGSAGFLSAIGSAVKEAPVQATGGPEKMHMVAFSTRDGKRLTISLVNDFSWVKTGAAAEPRAKGGKAKTPAPKAKSKSAEGEDEPTIGAANDKAPPPCRDVRVFVYGRGLPATAKDMVTGVVLQPEPVPGGFALRVPAFACMSVIVLE